MIALTALALSHDTSSEYRFDDQGSVGEGGSCPVQIGARGTTAAAVVGVVSLERARAHAAPDEEAAST